MAFLFIFGKFFKTHKAKLTRMKKVFIFCFLILSIQNLFGQNCNLEFGVNNDFDSRRAINNYNLSFCEGIPITLIADAIPNATYQWFFDDKEIADATKPIYALKNGSGKYTVRAIAGTCTYTRTIIITFTKYLQTFINEKTQFICEKNGWVDLYGHPFSDEKFNYQWQRDNVDIDGAVGISYRANKAGVYTVRMSQGACSTSISPTEVKTSNLKTNQIIVGDVVYTKDTTLEFCAGIPIRMVTNYGNIDYTDFKVFKDDKPFTFRNGDKISESGKYRIELKKGDCQLVTPTIDIKFGKTIPQFNIGKWIPSAFDECGKKAIYISSSGVSASTNNSFVVEWRKDGVKQIEQPLGYVFTATKTGTYTALLKNGECQRESEKFEIKSFNSEIVPFRANLFEGKKIEACLGQALTINLYLLGNKQFEIYRNGIQVYSTERIINYKITESGKYYAIIKDGNLCTPQYTDTLEVTIKGRKTAPISLDNGQCQNGNFNLSVPEEAGLSYSWKKDGKIIPNLNTAKITVKEAGSYSAVINQDFCSAESSEIVIGAKIKTNLPFCEGDTLKLSSSSANSYQWTGPHSFTSSSQNPTIPNISAKNNGIYKLSIKKDACTFVDSLALKVNPKPSITLDRADTYCLGKSISMIATTKSNNAYITWKTPVSYVNGSYLSINNSTKLNNGLYSVTATDYQTKCANTITTQLTFSENDCRSIELEIPSKSLCANVQNTLAFKLNGNFTSDETFDLYSLDYYGTKTKIASSTKSPISFNNRYYYRFFIESSKLKVRSGIIEVNTETPFVYISTTHTKACDGFSVPIKIDSNNYKFEKIQWLLNGKDIPNATKYTHNADKTGIYTVKAEKNGCIANYDGGEQKVNITIGEINPAYISTTNSSSVCDGFTVGLKTDTLYLKDTKYQWQLDGIDIPNATNSKFLASKTGNYTLKTIQGKCEAVSDKRKVYIGELKSPNVYSYPFILKNNEVEICNGIENSLQTSDYVIFTNRKDSLGYEAKFQWQKNGVDIPNATKEIFTSKEVGVYRLKVIQGNCVSFSKEITVKIGNPRLMSLYSPYLPKACEGDSVYFYKSERSVFNGITKQFTLFRDNKAYKEISESLWSIYVKESGKYFTTATFTVPDSKETCTFFSDTLNVEIKNKTVQYKHSDYYSSSCTDSLQVYSRYFPQIVTYQWKFNGNVLPNDTISVLTVKKAGTYQVESKNENGCTYTSEPFVIEFGKLNVELSEQDNIFCLKNENYLYPNIKGNYDYNLLSYEWTLDGTNIGKNNYQQISKSGTYTLKVNQGTCTGTASAKIEVIEIPKSINKDSLFICPNGSVIIEATKMDKYTWLLDNQPFANNETQNIKASTTGSYSVWMEKGECSGMSNVSKVIQKTILPTALISSTKDSNVGDSTRIKIDLTSSAPWTIKLTNNQTFTAERTPFEFNVKPTQTTIYELASVKNTCGEGTVSGKVEVNMTVLGNEEIEGAKINLFPVPTQSNCQLTVEMALPEKLEWQLFSSNGKLLSKAEKTKITPFFSQNIDLESLPSGTYLLKIIIGNKIATRKIIKQN